MIDDFALEKLIEPLQSWYQENARRLPWREDPSAYHVWISEIMLQQTRVEAVKPYYARFLEALPTVKDLAECPEDKYLKLWEGLGYYSRVRNLNAAARQVMEEYGGQLPSDYEELLKLKGIGHYTAGAISSLAFGRPVPAVDGNVLRVLTRVTGDDRDIMKQSFKTLVEAELSRLMKSYAAESGEDAQIPGKNADEVQNLNTKPQLIPGLFNQGLMELGALVCLPNGAPHCGDCPWKEFCIARKEGRIEDLPVKKKSKERRIEERTVLILLDGDKVALHKRPAKGLLAGLYELPNRLTHMTPEEALSYVREIGYTPIRIKALDPAKHIFSHVEWHMIGYQVAIEEDAFASDEQRKRAVKENLLFIETREARESYAIPNAFAAYAGYMGMK